MIFNSPEALERFKGVIDFLSGTHSVTVRGNAIIKIKVTGRKPWVIVRLSKERDWMPSFEDLFYIVKGIARCEEYIYEDPKYSASVKMYDFIRDVIFGDYCYEELADKYQLREKGAPIFRKIIKVTTNDFTNKAP